jgi:hypothetical protein
MNDYLRAQLQARLAELWDLKARAELAVQRHAKDLPRPKEQVVFHNLAAAVGLMKCTLRNLGEGGPRNEYE